MNPSGPIPCPPVVLLPWPRQSSQRIAVLASAPSQGTHSSSAGLGVPLRASANLGSVCTTRMSVPPQSVLERVMLSCHFTSMGSHLGGVEAAVKRTSSQSSNKTETNEPSPQFFPMICTAPLVSQPLPHLPFSAFLFPESLWLSAANFPIFALQVCLEFPRHSFFPNSSFPKSSPMRISLIRRPNSGRLHMTLLITD